MVLYVLLYKNRNSSIQERRSAKTLEVKWYFTLRIHWGHNFDTSFTVKQEQQHFALLLSSVTVIADCFKHGVVLTFLPSL